MTRPYDAIETDDDLRDVFGDAERAPRQRYGSTDNMPADGVELSQLPEPTCALHAPPPTPVEWIVRDLFTAGDLGLIVGDGGSFKSSAAIHIAAAVAGGYKAFDRFETKQGRVLVCSAEDPGSVIQMRLEAFVRGHDWDRERVLRDFYYFAMAGLQLKDARWKRHLVQTVALLSPSFVVMDPFVDLSGLEEENSNSEASGVMSFARELARYSQANVCFVHHANKSGEGRSQSRVRGATTIPNASRGTLFFEFTEAGVMVEQLKMTYAEKVPPFMLQREIVSEPTNRAAWITARLGTVKPAEARLTRAETFVLEQVTASPRVLNTNAIKRAAKGTGVWAEDAAKAVRSLYGKGLIDFEKGPNSSQLWYVADAGIGARNGSGSPDIRNVIEVSRTHSTHPNFGRAEWAEGASGSPEPTTAPVGRVPTGHTAHDPRGAGPGSPEFAEPDDTQALIWGEEIL